MSVGFSKPFMGSHRYTKKSKREPKLPRHEGPLSLEMADAASSEAAEEDNGTYEEWGAKDIQFFAKEAANKKDRLKLLTLVSSPDNIREKVIQKQMLAGVLTTLKQMERLPRKDKLNTLLETLQNLASDAMMAICPPGKDETPETAEKGLEQTRAAATSQRT